MGLTDLWDSAKDWVSEIGETPMPKLEPDISEYSKYIKKKGGKYLFPAEWNKDGTPKKYKEMNARDLNRLLVRLNVRILKRKIALYSGVITYYNGKIDRLKLSLSSSTKKGAEDAESRASLQQRVKLMWEHYETKYRNTSDRKTPEARAYRERILALQRTIPKKTDIEEYHQGRVKRYTFDLKEMEKVASAMARGKNVELKPKVSGWEGDLKDLVDSYESDLNHVKKNFLKPHSGRLDESEGWLKDNK